MKKLVSLPDYCLACGMCAIYCSAAHAGSELDVVKAFKQGPPPPALVVEKSEMTAQAAVCRHCEVPYCLAGCIAGAISKDPQTGVVTCDQGKCVGCWTCVAACPYGAITVRSWKGERARAYKCDLCRGISEVPMCVKHCPNEALLWQEIEGEGQYEKNRRAF